MVLYPWLVFVHVASILLLLLMHGGVVAATYMVRQERNPERLGALLDLSAKTFDSRGVFGRVFWIDLLVMIASGIALMVMGGFWRQGWTWASMVLFVVIMVSMTHLGSRPMGSLRRAAGLPSVTRQGMRRPEWAEPGPVDAAGVEAAAVTIRPGLLSLVGGGGFLLLLWLMMFKPF